MTRTFDWSWLTPDMVKLEPPVAPVWGPRERAGTRARDKAMFEWGRKFVEGFERHKMPLFAEAEPVWGQGAMDHEAVRLANRDLSEAMDRIRVTTEDVMFGIGAPTNPTPTTSEAKPIEIETHDTFIQIAAPTKQAFCEFLSRVYGRGLESTAYRAEVRGPLPAVPPEEKPE